MKDNNGNKQAFPQEYKHTPNEYGLTKREYFAAMAMQAILSNPNFNGGDNITHTAEDSVRMASALLRELEE